MFVKVEYDEKGCFLEAPYLFGEDEKYAQYMQVGKSDDTTHTHLQKKWKILFEFARIKYNKLEI